MIRKLLNVLMIRINNRGSAKLSKCLRSILEEENVTLVDIGAAGDLQPRWKRVSSLVDYVGFEPDKRSYDELIKQNNSNCRSYNIHNSAVWSRPGALAINFCKKPMVSSHYEPNREFVDRFLESDRFDVVSCDEIAVQRLDDLIVDKVDFIKLDIQGGELEALRGGETVLSSSLGLEIEVEFIGMYISQPLFGDVCTFLQERGFEFVDFTSINRWQRKQKPQRGYGQAVFGDALFLKSPETVLKHFSSDIGVLKRYVTICALYGRFDLIEVLENSIEESRWMNQLSSLRRRQMKTRNRITLLNKVLFFFGGKNFLHLID